MLRLSLFSVALLTATAPDICAQAVASHAILISVTPLGTYVPELEGTLAVLGKHATDTPDEDRLIASTAWQALAFAGAGSSMRNGRHKRPLRTLMVWLTRQQRAFHLAPDKPHPSRADSILMSLTFARIGSESDHSLVKRFIPWSLDMWLTAASQKDAPPLTSDEIVLLALLAQSLKVTEYRREQQQILAMAKQALAERTTGKDGRLDGVRHFVERVSGRPFPPEQTAAKCWPDNELADPLHTWFGAFTLRLLPPAIRASHRDRTKR
ncbi:MAG: hypothetical protein ACI9S9_001401 [Planctomycetota bacterium]|jgi:hypothetical protein